MSFNALGNIFEKTGDIQCHNNITHIHHHRSESPLQILEKHANIRAVHNSAERETEEASICQEDTRTRILSEMHRWVEGEGPHIAWLYGPAGSGKTTIAHTVVERCGKKENIFAFSYFFSRRNLARNDLTKFVSTFAYQLLCAMPPLSPLMKNALDSNPAIFQLSIEKQLETLFVRPLIEISKLQPPPNPLRTVVIVVDGLDEYTAVKNGLNGYTALEDGGVLLPNLFNALVKALPGKPFRLFFTSRPEPNIRELFVNNSSIKADAKEIPLRDVETRDDVYKYLTKELEKVRKRKHIQQPWPKEDDLLTLAEKSEGIFIYISTLVKFVGAKNCNSAKRLQKALESHNGLDPLFEQVLVYAAEHEDFWDVFDVVMFLKVQLSIQNIAMLLQGGTYNVRSALEGCQSILVIPDDDDDYIRPYHASLLDFLNDPNRFGKYFHSPAHSHATLFDVCSPRILDDKDLSSPFDDSLFYAYRNWCRHLFLTLSNENGTNNNRLPQQELANNLFKTLLQEPMIWLCRMFSHTEVKEWLAELDEVNERAKENSDYVSDGTELRKRVQKFEQIICAGMPIASCINRKALIRTTCCWAIWKAMAQVSRLLSS